LYNLLFWLLYFRTSRYQKLWRIWRRALTMKRSRVLMSYSWICFDIIPVCIPFILVPPRLLHLVYLSRLKWWISNSLQSIFSFVVWCWHYSLPTKYPPSSANSSVLCGRKEPTSRDQLLLISSEILDVNYS
jgi:hypothetical protein